MCFYKCQKVTRKEFMKLDQLKKAVANYDFLKRDLQIGFGYRMNTVLKPIPDWRKSFKKSSSINDRYPSIKIKTINIWCLTAMNVWISIFWIIGWRGSDLKILPLCRNKVRQEPSDFVIWPQNLTVISSIKNINRITHKN